MYRKAKSPCSIEKFEEILNDIGTHKVHKTGILYFNGSKPYIGLSEKRFGNAIDEHVDGFTAKSASFYGYHQMIAVRHMDFDDNLDAVYIGITSKTSDYQVISQEAYQASIQTVLKAIAKMLKACE
uniref:Uncharacterized protein n=1 Tax=Euplotes harpa TaxID=151035 RepID=A0A7S3N5V6_9SPIT|mmetsp:Transcript_10107/g.11359  ORF Transcript_10107/g.11359 Transcript_10107/m.11359 type:complete len:126 (+) Transcript_10107:169-546(+)